MLSILSVILQWVATISLGGDFLYNLWMSFADPSRRFTLPGSSQRPMTLDAVPASESYHSTIDIEHSITQTREVFDELRSSATHERSGLTLTATPVPTAYPFSFYLEDLIAQTREDLEILRRETDCMATYTQSFDVYDSLLMDCGTADGPFNRTEDFLVCTWPILLFLVFYFGRLARSRKNQCKKLFRHNEHMEALIQERDMIIETLQERSSQYIDTNLEFVNEVDKQYLELELKVKGLQAENDCKEATISKLRKDAEAQGQSTTSEDNISKTGQDQAQSAASVDPESSENVPAQPPRNLTPEEQEKVNASKPDFVLAQQEYDRKFPNGYEVLKTDGDGLCGLHAICLSLQRMHPLLPACNFTDLLSFRSSDAWQEMVEITATDSHDWFSPDELQILLDGWGQRHGLSLRLGLRPSKTMPMLMKAEAGPDGDTSTVWIHHNSEEERASHYSGLRAITDEENIAMLLANSVDVESLRAEKSHVRAKLTKLTVEHQRYKDAYDGLARDCETLQKGLNDYKRNWGPEAVDKYKINAGLLQKAIDTLRDELEKTTEKRQELERLNNMLTIQNEMKKNQCEKWKAQQKKLEEDIEAMRSAHDAELSSIQAPVEHTSDAIEILTTELSKLTLNSTYSEDQLKAVFDEINKLKDQNAKLKARLESCKKAKASLTASIENSQRVNNKASDEKSTQTAAPVVSTSFEPITAFNNTQDERSPSIFEDEVSKPRVRFPETTEVQPTEPVSTPACQLQVFQSPEIQAAGNTEVTVQNTPLETTEQSALSGWNAFGDMDRATAQQQLDDFRRAQATRAEEEQRTGVSQAPKFSYNEIYRKVGAGEEPSNSTSKDVQKTTTDPNQPSVMQPAVANSSDVSNRSEADDTVKTNTSTSAESSPVPRQPVIHTLTSQKAESVAQEEVTTGKATPPGPKDDVSTSIWAPKEEERPSLSTTSIASRSGEPVESELAASTPPTSAQPQAGKEQPDGLRRSPTQSVPVRTGSFAPVEIPQELLTSMERSTTRSLEDSRWASKAESSPSSARTAIRPVSRLPAVASSLNSPIADSEKSKPKDGGVDFKNPPPPSKIPVWPLQTASIPNSNNAPTRSNSSTSTRGARGRGSRSGLRRGGNGSMRQFPVNDFKFGVKVMPATLIPPSSFEDETSKSDNRTSQAPVSGQTAGQSLNPSAIAFVPPTTRSAFTFELPPSNMGPPQNKPIQASLHMPKFVDREDQIPVENGVVFMPGSREGSRVDQYNRQLLYKFNLEKSNVPGGAVVNIKLPPKFREKYPDLHKADVEAWEKREADRKEARDAANKAAKGGHKSDSQTTTTAANATGNEATSTEVAQDEKTTETSAPAPEQAIPIRRPSLLEQLLSDIEKK